MQLCSSFTTLTPLRPQTRSALLCCAACCCLKTAALLSAEVAAASCRIKWWLRRVWSTHSSLCGVESVPELWARQPTPGRSLKSDCILLAPAHHSPVSEDSLHLFPDVMGDDALKPALKTVKSADVLCDSQNGVVDAKEESIFTSALLLPLFFLGAYLVLLQNMSHSLEMDMMSAPHLDPFKKVWWSGPISATVLYIAGVFLGMHLMKSRREFQIKPYIFTYNLYQCILNLWCVLAMVHEVYTNPWFKAPWGNPPQRGVLGFRVAFLVWVHYINKYVELLDTLWMILRKKNNQVSFLHCYHHVLLIWAWFLVCKVESGGDSYFGATVNSFIHVIMYGYYTLALLNFPCPWKKWITNCQMLQFVVCLVHAFYCYYKENVPRILPLAQAFVMINMLVLFGHFYVESYLKKEKRQKKEKRP